MIRLHYEMHHTHPIVQGGHMNRDHIEEALLRLDQRGEWYESPGDFRAGMRCLANELCEYLRALDSLEDKGSGQAKASETVRAS
jgi:hypothetical protein